MTFHTGKLQAGRVWLIAALALASAGLVGCQGDDDTTAALLGPDQALAGDLAREGAPRPILNRLARQLDLSKAQRERVGAILRRERRAMAESGVFERGPEAIHQAMTERRERVSAEISTILSTEQRARFEAMKEKLQAKLAGGHGHGERLARELDLSAEQQAQVRGLMEQQRAAMRAVQERVRSGSLTRRDARPLLRAERVQLHARISELLTPEQRTRFEGLARDWREGLRRER